MIEETGREQHAATPGFDIGVIRPQMRSEEVRFRGQDMPADRRKKIKSGLFALHTLEGMAANIYRFQLSGESSELNRQLVAALCNEMTHFQDFEVKLREYGWQPSKVRWAYELTGLVLGTVSRLKGPKGMLRMAIWAETKAVHHYDQLLKTVDWDEDTRRIIEKDQADEHGHIARWKNLMNSLEKGTLDSAS